MSSVHLLKGESGGEMNLRRDNVGLSKLTVSRWVGGGQILF